jgi:hypothetical protein
MRNETSRQIRKMKNDINFSNVNWKILNDYLPEKLLEELDEEHDTNIYRQLSTTSGDPSSLSTSHEVHNPIEEVFVQPNNTSNLNSECHQTNIRNEIIKRFLTAMSVDYEKQWYLGMIRPRTLKILIETVEEAKTKLSLRRHWQLLVERFCMPLQLQCLVKFDKIKWLNRITEKLLFDHLILTIELTLGKMRVIQKLTAIFLDGSIMFHKNLYIKHIFRNNIERSRLGRKSP